MKLLNTIGFILCISMTAFAQTQKPANCENCYSTIEANQHIGENIKVYGVVKQVSPSTSKSGKNMFYINIDGIYPDNTFTIVVFKDSYQGNTEELLELIDKKLIFSGIVTKDEKYKKPNVELKPSMIAKSKSQFEIY